MSFFFSSRRRHTRCSRDWSSDVCSSDLEAAAGELVAAERVGAGPLLDGLAELALELLALGLERLETEAGAGLEQREDAVGVVAERPAEVGRAVPRRPRVDERLEEEVLLAGLTPEERRVVGVADVVDHVGVELLEPGDDRCEVVDGGEGVVLR